MIEIEDMLRGTGAPDLDAKAAARRLVTPWHERGGCGHRLLLG